MSEALAINNEQITKVCRRNNTVNVVFDYDAFNFAEECEYDNDFEFIKAFVLKYNGKDISEYETFKTRIAKGDDKRKTEYSTARMPQSDKEGILKKLIPMFDLETKRINSKTTRYSINSVNFERVERMKTQDAFWAKKFGI